MKETTLLVTNRYANYLSYDRDQTPRQLKMDKCFPYLVNTNRLIKFEIPKYGSIFGKKVKAKLTILDVFRNEISTLVNDKLRPGKYEVLWNVSKLSYGTYFYELSTETEKITNRLELLNN